LAPLSASNQTKRHSNWIAELSIFRKSVLAYLGYYLISGIVHSILLAGPLSLTAYGARQFVSWRVHHAVATLPLWPLGASAFVASDLGFHWGHRRAHEVPFRPSLVA
jgi:sterol desaturase/sphingolipid hydroxylase (fatty acid hydroxylase superfamily)